MFGRIYWKYFCLQIVYLGNHLALIICACGVHVPLEVPDGVLGLAEFGLGRLCLPLPGPGQPDQTRALQVEVGRLAVRLQLLNHQRLDPRLQNVALRLGVIQGETLTRNSASAIFLLVHINVIWRKK